MCALHRYHKKTSAGTPEVHAVLERIFDGSPLEEAHEVAQQIATTLRLVSDAQAQIALKSRAHAAYMLAAAMPNSTGSRAGSPRPSRPSGGSATDSGRASRRRASSATHAELEAIVIRDEESAVDVDGAYQRTILGCKQRPPCLTRTDGITISMCGVPRG